MSSTTKKKDNSNSFHPVTLQLVPDTNIEYSYLARHLNPFPTTTEEEGNLRKHPVVRFTELSAKIPIDLFEAKKKPSSANNRKGTGSSSSSRSGAAVLRLGFVANPKLPLPLPLVEIMRKRRGSGDVPPDPSIPMVPIVTDEQEVKFSTEELRAAAEGGMEAGFVTVNKKIDLKFSAMQTIYLRNKGSVELSLSGKLLDRPPIDGDNDDVVEIKPPLPEKEVDHRHGQQSHSSPVFSSGSAMQRANTAPEEVNDTATTKPRVARRPRQEVEIEGVGQDLVSSDPAGVVAVEGGQQAKVVTKRSKQGRSASADETEPRSQVSIDVDEEEEEFEEEETEASSRQQLPRSDTYSAGMVFPRRQDTYSGTDDFSFVPTGYKRSLLERPIKQHSVQEIWDMTFEDWLEVDRSTLDGWRCSVRNPVGPQAFVGKSIFPPTVAPPVAAAATTTGDSTTTTTTTAGGSTAVGGLAITEGSKKENAMDLDAPETLTTTVSKDSDDEQVVVVSSTRGKDAEQREKKQYQEVIDLSNEGRVEEGDAVPGPHKMPSPRPNPLAKIVLYKGGVTDLEIDCIVNAANERCMGGSGVDGAIHDAAGPLLVRECATFPGCKTGQTRITKGYNLPAKFVLHTVGPIGERPTELKSSYKTCFQLAAKHNLRSIGFCCISTGIFGYPLQNATVIAIQTAIDVLTNTPELKDSFDLIVFACFRSDEYACYKKILERAAAGEDITKMSARGRADERTGLLRRGNSPPERRRRKPADGFDCCVIE